MERAEHEYLCRHGDDDWWQVGMRAAALALVPPGLRGAALDVGCGCGYVVRDLRARGLDAQGIELDPYPVDYARRLGLGAVVRLGRLEEALGTSSGLALVTMLDVLPHSEVGPGVVAAAAAALAPGGRLLLRVPAFPRLYGAHDRFVHQTRRYARGDLRRLAADGRLAVERLTFANCAAFPLVLAGRTVELLRDRGARSREAARSSNRLLPAPLNATLRAILLAEAALLRRGGALPWGSSLLALLRKGG